MLFFHLSIDECWFFSTCKRERIFRNKVEKPFEHKMSVNLFSCIFFSSTAYFFIFLFFDISQYFKYQIYHLRDHVSAFTRRLSHTSIKEHCIKWFFNYKLSVNLILCTVDFAADSVCSEHILRVCRSLRWLKTNKYFMALSRYENIRNSCGLWFAGERNSVWDMGDINDWTKFRSMALCLISTNRRLCNFY